MAFLAAIKERSDLRMQGVSKEADDRDPTTVVDTPWVTELNPRRYAELASGGKWMQFYDHKDIYLHWRYAQYLYRNGKLEGVSNMKVSTMHDHHKFGSGVIIFYCGPSDDGDKCRKIGKNILKETGYTNLSKKMLYKTDTQTLAKGAQGFYKWELKIPKENFDNLKEKNEEKQKIKDTWKGDGIEQDKTSKKGKKGKGKKGKGKGKGKQAPSKQHNSNENENKNDNENNNESEQNESKTDDANESNQSNTKDTTKDDEKKSDDATSTADTNMNGDTGGNQNNAKNSNDNKSESQNENENSNTLASGANSDDKQSET